MDRADETGTCYSCGAQGKRHKILRCLRRQSAAEAHQIHQAGGLPMRFLDPFDDARRVGRILQFDGDGAVDAQFLDRLEIRLEFNNAAAGRQVPVHFAVTIADVDMDGFVFQLGKIAARCRRAQGD